MADKPKPEDLMSVGTRVSWSAIVAGALVALALSVSLSVLGVALGLSITDSVAAGTLETGATVWSIATVLVSLFIGGYTASLATAGETKGESLIYGVLVWGVLFLLMPLMGGLGAKFGFGELLGGSKPDGEPAVVLTDEQMDKLNLDDDEKKVAREFADVDTNADPATVAWVGFAGLSLSLIASIIGAVCGAGPELVFGALYPRDTVAKT